MNRIFLDHQTKFVTAKYENEANRFALELIYSDEELAPFLRRPVEEAAIYMGTTVQLAKWRLEAVEPSLFHKEWLTWDCSIF